MIYSAIGGPNVNGARQYRIGGTFLPLTFHHDSDNDGIADSQDKCPKEAGVAALEGCPDRDSDGITDAEERRLAIGYVAPDLALYEELTGLKVPRIMYGAA